MTTTPGNATTWRELADQLTDDERATLEGFECRQAAADKLLQLARGQIEGRLADLAYSDVPAPADANYVGTWEKNLKRDGWSRSLVWRDFDGVSVDGAQQCDGSVERWVSLYLDDEPKLSGDQARKLAAVLIEAADELDRSR